MIFDWIQFHLAVNHFPVVLGWIGALAALGAAARRSDAVWNYAAVTLILAGIFAPVALLTGRQAEEEAEQALSVDHAAIHAHEERAEIAMWLSLAVAALAIVSLRRPRLKWRLVLCVLALVAGGAMAVAALEGGKITHQSPNLEKPAATGVLP